MLFAAISLLIFTCVLMKQLSNVMHTVNGVRFLGVFVTGPDFALYWQSLTTLV